MNGRAERPRSTVFAVFLSSFLYWHADRPPASHRPPTETLRKPPRLSYHFPARRLFSKLESPRGNLKRPLVLALVFNAHSAPPSSCPRYRLCRTTPFGTKISLIAVLEVLVIHSFDAFMIVSAKKALQDAIMKVFDTASPCLSPAVGVVAVPDLERVPSGGR